MSVAVFLQCVAMCCWRACAQCYWISMYRCCSALQFVVVYCNAVCCSVLQCVAGMLELQQKLMWSWSIRVAVCRSVLQCVASEFVLLQKRSRIYMHWRCSVLQCIAECCSVLKPRVVVCVGSAVLCRQARSAVGAGRICVYDCCRALQGVAECCRVLQSAVDAGRIRTKMYCSVLQSIAECCSC